MREKKIRAWNKAHGRFEYVIFPKGQIIQMTRPDFSSADCYEDWQDFTGLKDKNRKEIYEGDIVSLNTCKCVVYWNDCGFALTNTGNKVWNWNGNLKGYCDGMWGGPPEIIGNVYESPELIHE